MNFTDLNLNNDLQKAISECGFTACTKVQDATLAGTLKGKDVCVQSQTGTGKTAAFLITIFELVIKDPPENRRKSLIIAPTRELALQIEEEAQRLGKYLDISAGAFYGGMSPNHQRELLKKGVDIIIGTPGRLIDLGTSGRLNLKSIRILVIDEADRLFDMGFLPDIRRLIKKLPSYSKRMTMLFSATLSYRARELAWEYMNDPLEIEIAPKQMTVDTITQTLYHVGHEEKMSLLLGILKRLSPESGLIFTNTKQMAYEVAKRLKVNGYECEYIIGDLPQKRRLSIINRIKSGHIRFLVATNVAARGIHIDDLDMVINYDVPEDCEDYVHRIGRTARAGKSGRAITLACDRYVESLQAIEKFTKMKLPVIWADDDLFIEDKSAGTRFSLFDEKLHTLHRKPSPSQTPSRRPTRTRPLKKAEPKKHHKTKPISPTEDRMAYYARKYGDNFSKGK